jgi:ABC-type Fe3+/spermidine/putrescine transport system ATPase subunit
VSGSGAALELHGLSKRFGDVAALTDVSLDVTAGSILALLGPSGSGKTTLLRLLAGFEQPDAGTVLVNGEDVTRLAPAERRFGMVFQHYALFPHLNVAANVAYGLESLGVQGSDLTRRVTAALELVDLAGYEARQISQLSGGQQQRVALARALAPEPRVLLLDEPLSNLDPALREHTRAELRDLIHRLGITAVFVTHEQDEAFDLGDRVALLRLGRLEQAGPPEELYAHPASPFVAQFIGRSSALPVTIVGRSAHGVIVELHGLRWEVPGSQAITDPGAAWLYARPEALYLTAPGPATLRGTVSRRRFTGSGAAYLVTLADGRSVEVAGPPAAAQAGMEVGMAPTRRGDGGLHLFREEGAG